MSHNCHTVSAPQPTCGLGGPCGPVGGGYGGFSLFKPVSANYQKRSGPRGVSPEAVSDQESGFEGPHDALRTGSPASTGLHRPPGLDPGPVATTSSQNERIPNCEEESIAMTRPERRDLLTAALTHLGAAANLLEEAEEGVLAEEARELNDKVDVVALVEPASPHAV